MIETIVSEEDFLQTFKGGLDNLRDYKLVRKLRAKKESCKIIAQKIGRPETTIQGWISNNRKPQGLSALEQAKATNVIPLTKDSPKLPALYEMCFWVFWTGCLTKNYAPMICEKPEIIENLKEYFLKTLQLESTHVTGQKVVRFNKCYNYGRVLNRMGIPAGYRKSIQELHIPRAIAENPETHYRFLEIMFRTRKSITKKHWVIYLIENRDENRAEAFGKEVLKFINTALPELSITDENLHLNRNRHAPRISLSKRVVAEIERYYPRLIEPDGLLPENSYCNTHNTSTCQQATQ